MIAGVVTSSREAVIRFLVRGAPGREEEVESVIDTGFTGFLTLPTPTVHSLGLPYAGAAQGTLADASIVSLDVFEAVVWWDDRERDILVLAAEGATLVGMALLSGYRVPLDVESGGAVRIEALP